MEQIDIAVIGGGIAGLTATAAFASAGFRTVCVDPAPRSGKNTKDQRSTAFLQPSRDLLERIDVWSRLESEAQPLATMRLIDAGGLKNEPREDAKFEASDIGERPFGWNLPNAGIRAVLERQIETLPDARLHAPDRLDAMFVRNDSVHLQLRSGKSLICTLVVAADGRDSFVRRTQDIRVTRRSFDQKALVFSVAHESPHHDVSTEIHRTGGPFTLVPLPDQNGRAHSAVVWMEDAPEAARLAALSPAELSRAATARSCRVLGRLDVVSNVALWPIISQISHTMHGPRTAYIAEAAHVLPPIGAQGLNLSLSDIACLLDLTEKARAQEGDIGDTRLLTRYSATRWPDAMARFAGISLLNDAARVHARPLRDLRRLGLAALHRTPPLRRWAMRTGLGLR